MTDRILADLIVIIHSAFILFAVFGSLLFFYSRRFALIHLPAVVWVAVLEFQGLICPLTPLENHFRLRAGLAGYSGGFIEHYFIPTIYPVGLTRGIQIALGAGAVVINLLLYYLAWRKHRAQRATFLNSVPE